jgi:hypothetical protein
MNTEVYADADAVAREAAKLIAPTLRRFRFQDAGEVLMNPFAQRSRTFPFRMLHPSKWTPLNGLSQ